MVFVPSRTLTECVCDDGYYDTRAIPYTHCFEMDFLQFESDKNTQQSGRCVLCNEDCMDCTNASQVYLREGFQF
eukprot:SAG31_NODE_22468_length_524_cov_11.597647_1_plen_73_part_01